MKPALRRELVRWTREAYQLTERRACRAVGASRSSFRYRSRRPRREPLRKRLHELAATRVRSGYRQFHVLLRREGWRVNHKLVYRLYREEGLTLARRRRRRRASVVRSPRTAPTRANDVWAMDFVHDSLVDGRTFRVLTVLDVHTRECAALRAGASLGGGDVAAALDGARAERGALPARIRADNGTEFTSKALDRWAWARKVELDFSRPGKPTDNAFIEAFNGTLRRECLSQQWFGTLEEVRRTLEAWRLDYNRTRPHSGLRGLTPADFRAAEDKTPSPK